MWLVLIRRTNRIPTGVRVLLALNIDVCGVMH